MSNMKLYLVLWKDKIFAYVFAELDPTRVCKGKGAVTLRATLVHIDDEDGTSQELSKNSAKSELEVQDLSIGECSEYIAQSRTVPD